MTERSATYWRRREFDWARRGIVGFDRHQFEALAEAQEDRCACCGRVPRQSLCVDHDHVTGKVRGLTCAFCNHKIIGQLEQFKRFFVMAVAYLSRYDKSFVFA